MSGGLTLVMPTMGRPDFVERSLAYYASVGLSAPIVVADGSEPADAARCAEVCERQSGPLSVRHLHTTEPYVDRILAAIRSAETECLALVGDDDFFVPAALDVAVDLLATNASAAAVTGRGLTIVESEGPGTGWSGRVLNWAQGAFAGDAAEARLLAYSGEHESLRSAPGAGHLTPTFYAVRRREVAERVFARMAALEFDVARDVVFMEQFDATLLLLEGSVSLIDRLLIVRSGGHPRSGGAASRRESYFDRLVDPHWSHRVAQLVEIVAQATSADFARDYVRTVVGRNVVLGMARELAIPLAKPRQRGEVRLAASDVEALATVTEFLSGSS